MTFAVAAQRQLNKEEFSEIKEKLIEGLMTANRYSEAADLIGNDGDFGVLLDCHIKSNNFQRAIKTCMEHGQLEKIESQIRPALLVACDLKRN